MRNSSPLELARSISGWKSLYQPPLPNLSDVAAKDVEEIRTNARTARARMANLPGSSCRREIAAIDEGVTASSRLRLPAVIAVHRRKQVQALKRPAHPRYQR